MTTVWSYGGGVQSAALGVLIKCGKLPLPDLAVIADTGREAETTWVYLHDVMQPYLGSLVPIHIAPHTLSGADLYSRKCELLIPAFTKGGMLHKFCSGTWKRDVIERWLRRRGVRECELWLGLSLDELDRMRNDHRPWAHYRYPLVEARLTRNDCAGLVAGAGLQVPTKSACFMCPYRTGHDWKALTLRDFRRACELEAELQGIDPDLYLHPSRRPLGTVAFDEQSDQVELFCETGFCFT